MLAVCCRALRQSAPILIGTAYQEMGLQHKNILNVEPNHLGCFAIRENMKKYVQVSKLMFFRVLNLRIGSQIHKKCVVAAYCSTRIVFVVFIRGLALFAPF